MITRFDHAVLAVGSLTSAAARMTDLFGFDVYPGGRHIGLGTENGVVRFGLDYLELLGIVDRNEVAAAGIKRAQLLDYVKHGRGGWLAYCMATDDIDLLAARFLEVGLESLGPYSMQRARPDGVLLTWRLLVPGGTAWRRPWPFFIQWDMPDTERMAVEAPGSHKIGDASVSGVTIIVRDLTAAEYLYAEQLGFTYHGRMLTDMPGEEAARFRLGNLSVVLLSPTAPGPTMDALEFNGEGLCEVRLAVGSQARAHQVLRQYALRWTDQPGDLTIDLNQNADFARQARLTIDPDEKS